MRTRGAHATHIYVLRVYLLCSGPYLLCYCPTTALYHVLMLMTMMLTCSCSDAHDADAAACLYCYSYWCTGRAELVVYSGSAVPAV